MGSSDVAAWVSAVGGLLAVGVAIALHVMTISDRRRSDRVAARSAAIHVLPAFLNAESQVSWVASRLADGAPADELGYDEHQSMQTLRILYGPANGVLAEVGILASLGSAAESAQRVAREMQALKKMLGEFSPTDAPDEWRFVGSNLPRTQQHIELLAHLIPKARKEIEKVAR